jgi:uncharacterized membrane protein required for colicin V production
MNLPVFAVSWVDLAVVAILITGFVRGRKRGMSEELLDVIRWALILVTAAMAHQPLGQMLAQASPFSLLSCYIFVYTMIIVGFKLIFAMIKRQIGDKLVSSDFFGSAEYYLGMVSGCFRYGCVMLVCFAFLNARYYSPEELQADNKFQSDNFGDIRFPTFSSLQDQVFAKSATGHMVQEFAPFILIPPTAPEDKGLGGNSVVRARERDVDQIGRSR